MFGASHQERSVVFMLGILIVLAGSAVAEDALKDGWQALDPLVRTTNHGVALMEQYDYAEAVKVFEKAVGLAPKSAEARLNLAIAVFNRSGKGDLELAEKLLDEVLAAAPDNPRALYSRAVAHQYSGRDEEAVKLFQRVLELEPRDAYVWYLLARSKTRLGQSAGAELTRAVQENAGLASAYYDLMRIAFQEGDEERAEEYQQKFTELRASPLTEMVVIPHYRRMGALATAQPLSAAAESAVTGGVLSVGAPQVVARGLGVGDLTSGAGAGLALADVNGDGRIDVLCRVTTAKGARLALLLGQADGAFRAPEKDCGLEGVSDSLSVAFGDSDNDSHVDLFVGCQGGNRLLRGRGDGTFEDVTERTGTAGGLEARSVGVFFLDADHDSDLDIFVANDGVSDQLLNNNGDGSFADIAGSGGVAGGARSTTMLGPADVDNDRDLDLVTFSPEGLGVFLNDRLGKYHAGRVTPEPVPAASGVVQDFNGDGRADVLVGPAATRSGTLLLSTATGRLEASAQYKEVVKSIGTWGDARTFRVADVDLDGDLDVALFGAAGHVLLNDGRGRFVARPNVWPEVFDDHTSAVELHDFTADGVPDLLRLRIDGQGILELIPTQVSPPAHWLAVTPTGDRGADKTTRSPASGYGTRIEVRAGLHSQVMTYTGLNGGPYQSHVPVVFGLNGVAKADYIAFAWPDGVTQAEFELAGGTVHNIKEMERRVSSCPVLFAWDGRHFEFIGDFAGVGGLGYFVAPGQYAPPQNPEYVRITSEQLVARDGRFGLRVCEPMEEVAYVDRLELQVVDHPADVEVYPDERLAVTGAAPTHRLICPRERIYPVRAIGPDGADCVEQLREIDRVYGYEPQRDRRFCGFCEPHTLTLEFDDRLAALPPGQGVFLFLTGSIEYPYSQTTYAASQAGMVWQPMRIDRLAEDGSWETIVADAGAPGGMSRTMAIDLTGKLTGRERALRIVTNLEIYYDRVFIAADAGTADLVVRSVPLVRADLRRLGFPMEYSPDGQHPTIYTYDVIEPTSSFKMPAGRYTRYGPVEPLLAEFDDQYVICGTGDEIAVEFDATTVPPLPDGFARTFILVSHAYCKDMDLYTGTPDTVKPLPFRTMEAYPYSDGEVYPGGGDWQRRWNTRRVP